MYNYQQLEVLETVARLRSFNKAARALHITQPAISQRLKNLEEELGLQLLVREQPIRATDHGEKLIEHFRNVRMLEKNFELEQSSSLATSFTKLTLGVNGDSLATWFFEAIKESLKKENLLLNLIIENEDLTFSRLRNSEVLGCISSRGKKLPGCIVKTLGTMRYRMAATPQFAKRFFKNGLTEQSVLQAPAVVYDDFDHMHALFLNKQLRLKNVKFPFHMISNSDAFLNSIRHGFSYGMAPELQAKKYFKDGTLVDLCPGHCWEYKLYWHHQRILDQRYKSFSDQLVSKAKKFLGE